MSLPKPNHSQIAIGVAIAVTVAVVGGLAWGFGRQIALGRRMRIEEQRLEQLVATEQARHDELVAQSEYVGSDEYVEDWARAEARMAKPGEVAVVVVREEAEEPNVDTQPTPTPEPTAASLWAKLRALFLGTSGR